MNRKKVLLIILDGWGIGNKTKSDAIFCAKTPNFDALLKTYPNATLKTYGKNVGLPEGQMGNSEVGHINIGAGKVVYQDLLKINKNIENKEFFRNNTLVKNIELTKKKNKNFHIMGLVSSGGVHSSLEHLYAIIDTTEKYNLENVYLHVFTDGRDTDPKSGIKYIKELEKYIKNKKAKIASISGRYYSMDRDLRWERTKKYYDLIINGIGEKHNSPLEAIESSYEKKITDEFIIPTIITPNFCKIKKEDTVLCFNFRTDRCRQITRVLTQENIEKYNMRKTPLNYITMTEYDKTFKEVKVLFKKDNLENTLGKQISDSGLSQLRIAETEKYPHVTFFFNGGREKPFKNEERIMINSPKVATYDLKPEMSAYEVTEKSVQKINKKKYDFICINFANPDMVGHTGVYNSIIKAVETTDECLGKVIKHATENNYVSIIIADHGNSDFVLNNDGTPNTSHSKNLVPFIITDKNAKVNNGILADIASYVKEYLKI